MGWLLSERVAIAIESAPHRVGEILGTFQILTRSPGVQYGLCSLT